MPIFGLIRPQMPDNPALYRFVLFVCPELGVWRKTGGERDENTWIYQQRGILSKHEQGKMLYMSTLSKIFNGALSDSSYQYKQGVPEKRNNKICKL